MQLTSFTDYSLRTLMYLASKRQGLSSVKEIAEYYGISRNHLVKVVHRLSQLGYIETSKGKNGGIKIFDKTCSMKLGGLINELEPNMHTVECFDAKNNTCKITTTCRLKHYLFEAKSAFIETLNQYTLNDTISNNLAPSLKVHDEPKQPSS